MNEKRHPPLLPTDIITALVSTTAVFLALAFGGKALEGYRLQRHNVMLRTEVGVLEKQREQLEEYLKYVQTPAYVEKVAREQYKWAKAGEKPIIAIFRRHPVETATPTPSPLSIADTVVSRSASHWREWWKLLVGN